MGMNYQSSLTDTFTKIIILATITTLVPYAFAAAAQLMLMFKEPERFSGRRLVADAAIAILAFGYSFWMIYGAGQEYIAQGFLLLLAGIPVYVYLKWRQAAHAESPVEAERPAARPAIAMHHGAFGGRASDHPITHAPSTSEGSAQRAPLTGVHSEVGRLRRVLLHRPGVELKRLTPTNKDDAALRRRPVGQARAPGARRVRRHARRPRRGGALPPGAADGDARAARPPTRR